jgi:DNA-binding CsgD family transcriptional regulator
MASDKIDAVPRGVAAWAEAMGARRGDARKVMHVFRRSLMPMVLTDGARVLVDVNRAARLLARATLAAQVGRRLDDFTPGADLPALRAIWDRLQRFGSIAGEYKLDWGEGNHLLVIYAGFANVLPGQNLLVAQPADWPEDELGEVDLTGVAEPSPGPLSPRELEVLTLVAAGCDMQEMAEELTIAPTTAKTHIRNALSKLGAHNRPHGVAIAMHLGLIDLPSGVGGQQKTSD